MADVSLSVMRDFAARLIRPEMGRTAVAVNGVYALLLTVVAVIPRAPSIGVSVSDKTLHVVAYGVAAALMVWALRSRRPHQPVWLPAVAGATILGVWTEILQLAAPERSFQWGDLVADGIGAVLGATLAALVLRPRKTP
jgi:VanZ family protein